MGLCFCRNEYYLSKDQQTAVPELFFGGGIATLVTFDNGNPSQTQLSPLWKLFSWKCFFASGYSGIVLIVQTHDDAPWKWIILYHKESKEKIIHKTLEYWNYRSIWVGCIDSCVTLSFWSCSDSELSRCSLSLYSPSKYCLVLFKKVVYLIKLAQNDRT